MNCFVIAIIVGCFLFAFNVNISFALDIGDCVPNGEGTITGECDGPTKGWTHGYPADNIQVPVNFCTEKLCYFYTIGETIQIAPLRYLTYWTLVACPIDNIPCDPIKEKNNLGSPPCPNE